MEVHAHTHTPRKKWTHYFWEFLMLFLAVFAGFLAENQREHIVEHGREKQYMQSLYSDVKKDTAFYNDFSVYLSNIYKRLDSVQNMANLRQYITDPGRFYGLAIGVRSIRYFESHNSAYEQLKNSGNLRLIRKKGLGDSIVDYYSMIQERVRNQESRYMQASTNIANAMWDILDAKYYIRDTSLEGKFYIVRRTVENVTMENVDEEKLLKYKNLCYEKMLLIPSFRNFILELNVKATTLLLLINNGYHIE